MSHQREFDRSHGHATSRSQDIEWVPNRDTRSSQLDAPAHPIASGLLQRKARDANGVAGDAEHAVAAASASSGAALPEPIQRKFEASLGSDLSSVRVHTGAESASAASAVGARAYTLGQDIHFAAGQFDPSSTAGEHLLAHEVAHTVQQRGGSPARQNKLEVSSPTDHLEHEADRAADAMIAGAAAAVTSGVGVARQVQRDVNPDPFNLGGGKKPQQPDTLDPLPGPVNPFIEGYNEKNAKPDPRDPYEQGPVTFDAVAAGAGPAEPTEWHPNALTFASPQAFVRPDGKPTKAGVTDAQREKSSRCVKAFEHVFLETVEIWNGIAGNVNEFQNASKKADELHLTGPAGAELDKPKDPTANLDKYGDDQKVGPGGKKTDVKDLFDGGRVKAPGDKVVRDEDQLDTPLKAALVTAERNVQVACANVGLAVGGKDQNAIKIKRALATVKLSETALAAADSAEKSKRLTYDKAQWGMFIDNTVTILTGVTDVITGLAAEKPDAVIKGTMSIIGTTAKWIVNADFDQKILQADLKVTSLQQTLALVAGDIAADDVTIAINEYLMDRDRIKNAKAALATAMAARKTAYDAFADAAGKQAKKGGASDEEAARVDAAIRAIPVVEEVVMRIKKVTGALRAPPAYSDDAGIGFRAAGQDRAFVQHYAWIKGYQTEFASHESKWDGRLRSLQQFAGKLYSKA